MTDVPAMLVDMAKKTLGNDTVDVEKIIDVAVSMAKAVKVEVELSETQKVDLVQSALRGLVATNMNAAALSKVIDSDLPAIILKELTGKTSLMDLFGRFVNLGRSFFGVKKAYSEVPVKVVVPEKVVVVPEKVVVVPEKVVVVPEKVVEVVPEKVVVVPEKVEVVPEKVEVAEVSVPEVSEEVPVPEVIEEVPEEIVEVPEEIPEEIVEVPEEVPEEVVTEVIAQVVAAVAKETPVAPTAEVPEPTSE